MKKIAISEDHIIVIGGESIIYYLGYDILTEEFVQIEKSKCIICNNALTKFVGNTKAQLLFADAITKNQLEASRLLNISERTYHRYQNDYNIHP